MVSDSKGAMNALDCIEQAAWYRLRFLTAGFNPTWAMGSADVSEIAEILRLLETIVRIRWQRAQRRKAHLAQQTRQGRTGKGRGRFRGQP